MYRPSNRKARNNCIGWTGAGSPPPFYQLNSEILFMNRLPSGINLETATTSELFSAMSDDSVCFCEIINGSKMADELHATNGGSFVIYKRNGWRVLALAQIVGTQANKLYFGNATASNTLGWFNVNGDPIT